MNSTLSGPVHDPVPSSLQSPADRARFHAEQDLQPDLSGEEIRDLTPFLTLDSPVCREALRQIREGNARVAAYYPFFFTAARIGIETWPEALHHWLALAFLAGFYLEQHPDRASMSLPEPDPQSTGRWKSSVFPYLEQDLEIYPRLVALIDAWMKAVHRDRPELYPENPGLREFLIGMDAIDLGRRFARETGDEHRERVRFAIEHYRSFHLQPHPSQWNGKKWPLRFSLELWQQQVVQSLTTAFRGPGAVLLHPLIQACRTRYPQGTREQDYFVTYYDLATKHSGLGLESGPIAWLGDALAYANAMIGEAPEIVVEVLHSLTDVELESEWRTTCNIFNPDQEPAREMLLDSVARFLHHNHGLLLRPAAPFVTIDQIVHSVDALVWKRFLDAFWEGEI